MSYAKQLTHDIIGLNGTSALWIFGKLKILGGFLRLRSDLVVNGLR